MLVYKTFESTQYTHTRTYIYVHEERTAISKYLLLYNIWMMLFHQLRAFHLQIQCLLCMR